MLRLEKSKRFGASSEKNASPQGSLFDEDDEIVEAPPASQAKETITYTRKTPNKHKTLDTSRLPREQNRIDLTDDEKRCACGATMTCFGEDAREELVYQPAVIKVIEHIRPKYTCTACETVKAAPAVELPIPKSKAGAELLARVMLHKYHFHLPFYRQSQALETLHNLHIPDNTLGGWAMQALEQLTSLREALWQALATVHSLQVDETPVKILQPNKKAYMWLYHSPTPNQRFVIFEFSLSRSADTVDQRLKKFSGLLQTDGYSGYNGQRARDEVTTLGCWDHCRRKFVEVVKAAGNNKSGKAGQVLQKIAKLYELERDIKSQSPAQKTLLRQQHAAPPINIAQNLRG